MYLRPETFNILGGGQAEEYQANRHNEHQGQSDSEPSRWEKFKTKAKRAWSIAMTVAEGIKDNIMPIIAGMGTFLAGLAAFRKCNSQYRGRTA